MALNFAQQSLMNPTGLEIIPYQTFYQRTEGTEITQIRPNDIIAAVPLSSRNPELMQGDGSTSRKRKRGVCWELKGERPTDFCLLDIYKTNDIREVNLVRDNGVLDPKELRKNLKGWKIEVREHQDKNGKCNYVKRYYHPVLSKWIRKSFAEVKKCIEENSYVREASVDDEISKEPPIILTGLEIIPHPDFNKANKANEIIAAEPNSEEGDRSAKRGRQCTTSKPVKKIPKDFCLLELYNTVNIQEVNLKRMMNGKVILDPEEVNKNLKGWTIDNRKRVVHGKCRIDKFYYHPDSKRTLRSLTEVRRWIEANSCVRNA